LATPKLFLGFSFEANTKIQMRNYKIIKTPDIPCEKEFQEADGKIKS
jgi:hypothetical protein